MKLGKSMSSFAMFLLIASMLTVPFSNNLAEAQNIPYKTYKVYIEQPPSYAPDGTYQIVIDALNYWKDRDKIEFLIQTEPGYQDIYIKWSKQLDERHVGYEFKQLIEVGLGDDYCRDTWNPFHLDYLRNIMTHEVGHAIGYEHENQYADSIMNSGGSFGKHYGLLEFEETVGENWNWRFQICNFDSMANISYYVESTSDKGVKIEFVPTWDDVQKAIAGQPHSKYIQGQCGDGKFYTHVSGTCSVDSNAWVFIKNGNSDATITLKMAEVNIPDKYYKVYAENRHEIKSTSQSQSTTSQSQTLQSTPKSQQETFDDMVERETKEEIKEIKSTLPNKIKSSYNSIVTLENSLALKYKNPDAQKKIDAAFKVLQSAKNKLNDVKRSMNDPNYMPLTGDNSPTAFNYYKDIERDYDDMANDLKLVSNAINDANKLEKTQVNTSVVKESKQDVFAGIFNSANSDGKICFLFWCW